MMAGFGNVQFLTVLSVLLLPALLSFPMAVHVGDSVSLSIPFPLPSFQIHTTIIWRKNATILAIGNLYPNFTVVVAPSFHPQFSVDPLRGNLNITAMTPSNSGIYTVEIFPLGNSVQKENFTVQVYEEVDNVSVSPPSAEATEGDSSVALNCTPVRGSVSWTKDGQSLGENPRYLSSAGYLQIRSPQRTDTGSYHCTISNPFSNGTGIANLTVYYGPETPTITISSSDQVLDARNFVLVNSTVNLTCLAPSEPQARIYWNVADTEDPDVPSLPILQLPRVQLNQAGPYSCLAINQRTQKRVRNTVNLKVAQAPSGVSISFQVHSNADGPVAVELHCQGIFNPVEIEWFRDKKSLIPTSDHYQLSPDRTRFTIWNFTAPQDLGDYSPTISNWTLSHGPHPGSAYLEWTIPKGSVVTSFWIQMQSPKQSRSGEEWKTVDVLGATNRSTTIMGLQSQTPYSFQIVPHLGSQAGNASHVQILQPPAEHLSGGAIAGIVIGSIFGMLLIIALLFLLIWLIWLTCHRRAKNKKVPLENQQHYLSRQFPNGNKLESNDPSWRNSCWSAGDSDIYAITYEKHLCKYGGPTSLPISTMDSSFPLPAPQPVPRHVRSATQV
ncbi:hypothetical protein JD844_005709 [Phrynosoma platyrhinos]|uniref:V-set and immunoglobulin domain-containing protein 10-like n=1 Tax=Phrynosoma platyrhinos TaxID=52577 RepID=A0ABQ7TPT9_PHRPL|nr:hypothetical protein JD844_005709 [Phrynosoma platyrhinos]